jgi:hypothetical protein
MKGPEAIIFRYSDHFHELSTLPRLSIGPLRDHLNPQDTRGGLQTKEEL